MEGRGGEYIRRAPKSGKGEKGAERRYGRRWDGGEAHLRVLQDVNDGDVAVVAVAVGEVGQVGQRQLVKVIGTHQVLIFLDDVIVPGHVAEVLRLLLPHLPVLLAQLEGDVVTAHHTPRARQGKARQGKARQGKARQGKARQGKSGQIRAREIRARQISGQGRAR